MHPILLQLEIPKEFFTLQSMLTLTGAAGATYIICNGLQRAFNFNPRWLALAIGILISLYGVYETSPGRVSDYFIGIINGFLIFCTAAGATELGAAKTETTTSRSAPEAKAAPSAVPPAKRQFRSSWF